MIRCDDLTISQSGSITKNIGFKVISTTAFNEPVTINNRFSRIEFLADEEQILLGGDNVPASATIEVSGMAECQNPCQ
ncbi:hypothetical protein [Sporohalobacter salinus]|uniref:hypothetical protein n=1 Tax=Sporohalobacter salinus TaxID=1494606 RepID=UPI001961EDB8|nr:hypothetical protein [Sporohalobacter salinus]MBM7625070.1 hypothetical protein [Sporohalobacter salinus]